MFCKNCGKEIADTAELCDGCGQDFSKPTGNTTEIKNTFHTLINKLKQNKILSYSILGTATLLTVFLIVLLLIPNKPSEKQIKSDFLELALSNGEEYEIIDIEVISDKKTNNNRYKADVDISFKDQFDEYTRHYVFDYSKKDNWVLEKLDCDTPEIYTVKSDFVRREANNFVEQGTCNITKFKIISEECGDEYISVVDIVFDNTFAEYSGQYEFIYNKTEEDWELDYISTKQFSKRPLNAPDIDEMTEKCKGYLGASYEIFELVKDKTETNMNKGIATLTFNTKTSTNVLEQSGEISFDICFDYDDNIWDITDYDFLESYKTVLKYPISWSGTATNSMSNYDETKKRTYIFTIKEYEEENFVAQLTFQNKSITLNGKVTLSNSITANIPIDFCNENEKFSVSGVISSDGKIDAKIDSRTDNFFKSKYCYYFEAEIQK